jgi:hypothetical protein
MTHLIGDMTVRGMASAMTLLVLCGTLTVASAEEFRIDLPQMETIYSYGWSSPTVPINLGTPLADLASIQLELAGTHTDGWKSDIYGSGADGGLLLATMDSASPLGSPWKGSYEGSGTGAFTATMTLHRSGGGSDWSFLQDGITDLRLENALLLFPGGGTMVTPPYFSLTNATLVVNATPTPEPSALVLLFVSAVALIAHAVRRRTHH